MLFPVVVDNNQDPLTNHNQIWLDPFCVCGPVTITNTCIAYE